MWSGRYASWSKDSRRATSESADGLGREREAELVGDRDGDESLLERCPHRFRGEQHQSPELLAATDHGRPDLSAVEASELENYIQRMYSETKTFVASHPFGASPDNPENP